ncbi:hypothetical protein D3C76_747720 [compost metagenome]
MPGGARAKGFAGQHRNAVTIEQAIGERLGAKPGFTDVDHHEHPAIGLQRADAGAIGEGVTHQVTTLTIGFAHRFQFRQVAFQRHHSSVLNEIRRAVKHAQREVFQVRGQGWRRHHPADAPAGHGVGFRQAVEGRGALGHARQAGRTDVLAFEQQFAVDLIGNQPQVVGDA